MQRNLAGYFGKLPDRADFVTGSCPDGFLKLWEPFLIHGLAQSRQELGGDWEDAYMTMPVWRFWMKPSVPDGLPSTCLAGALMPSVDRVGRKFPLTVVGSSEGYGDACRPSGAWYDSVEEVLLGALGEDATFKEFQEAISELAAPFEGAERDDESSCEHMEPAHATRDQVASRFWCQAGPRTYRFGCNGLPAPEAFRWLLLPEDFKAGSDDGKTAGQHHGRYQAEDHRT
ncbi:type VI secretion system-associated protein TagF [Roseibium sp.]|uniref:type VI secretion system-associated protein TagF n=1 Tax=Roseibium sp. TaxID=1936156 RepID=UPI003BA9EF96